MRSPLKRQRQSFYLVRRVERVLLVIRVLVEARCFTLRLLVLLLQVLLAPLHVCIWKLRLLGGLQLLRLLGKLTARLWVQQRSTLNAHGQVRQTQVLSLEQRVQESVRAMRILRRCLPKVVPQEKQELLPVHFKVAAKPTGFCHRKMS